MDTKQKLREDIQQVYDQFDAKSELFYVAMQRIYVDLAFLHLGDSIADFYDEKKNVMEYKAINEMLFSMSINNADYRSFKDLWQTANSVKHSTDRVSFQENYARLCATTYNNIYMRILECKEAPIDLDKFTETSESAFSIAISNALKNIQLEDKTSEEAKAEVFEETTKANQNVVGLNYLENIKLNFDTCPDCGSKMVLRHNRATGEPFYGCGSFPACRHTMSVLEYRDRHNYETQLDSAVDFVSRTRAVGCTVKFFQSLGVPKSFLDSINERSNLRKDVLPYSHWRIDYKPTKTFVSKSAKSVFSIAYKILTRGRITLVSPNIDRWLNVGNQSFDDFSFLIKAFNEPSNEKFWLDSVATEQKFYFDYLKTIMGKAYYSYVIPQADLATLVRSSEDLGNQRVDFAINDGEHKLVIEIDDSSHWGHENADATRNRYLEESDFTVIRIPSEEVKQGTGANLLLLRNELSTYNDYPIINEEQKKAILSKMAHQIQIAIVEALISGNVTCDSTLSVEFNTCFETKDEFIQLIINDLNEFIGRLSRLCGCDLSCNLSFQSKEKADFLITYAQDVIPNEKSMVITDIVYANDFINNVPPYISDFSYKVEKDNTEYFLQYIFRKEKFRDGQFDVVRNSLMKEDSIVLLPTGAGKSIAFQLSAMLTPGISFIVSPLISLMDDQVDNLYRNGLDRATQITSTQDYLKKHQLQYIMSRGDYNMVYIAPERLQMDSFRKTLKATIADIPVPLFIIDEAHCLSEWGHDFRTAYLNLGRIIRNYCKHRELPPTIIALTGTASESVLHDVQIQLDIHDEESIITPTSFDRKELHFGVLKCTNDEKEEMLTDILENTLPKLFNESANEFFRKKKSQTNGGIIFCPHVNGTYGAWPLYGELLNAGFDCGCYSGKKPKDYRGQESWDKFKQRNAEEFKNNETTLLVATNAFGMGIDKPNIRYTIHYNLPRSVEGYYQETGRAGRDRGKSWCFLISSLRDAKNGRFGNDDSFETNAMSSSFDGDDDLDRVAFFHRSAFKGINTELQYVKMVLSRIPYSEKKQASYDFEYSCKTLPCNVDRRDYTNTEGESDTEKGIYRLLLLGIIDDYTKNRSFEFVIRNNVFVRDYVKQKYMDFIARYNRQRVEAEKKRVDELDSIESDNDYILALVKALLEFNYEVIEKGRMRQIRSMYDIAMEASRLKSYEQQDDLIRKRVLAILEVGKVETEKDITSHPNCGFAEIIKQFNAKKTQEELNRFYGKTARKLESLPDHPGLLAIASIQSLSYTHGTYEEYSEQVCEFILNAIYKYSVRQVEVNKFVAWYLSYTRKLFDDKFDYAQFCDMAKRISALIKPRDMIKELSRVGAEKKVAMPFVQVHMNKEIHTINNYLDEIRRKRNE